MRLLPPGCFPSFRYSLFCREPLASSYAELWQEAAPHSILENLYGPTETTIAISYYRWNQTGSSEESVNGIVPIGWIFDGQECSVIDAERKAVSAGVPGELCLGGSQVTTGYWNEPKKTEEQFVRLPAAGESPGTEPEILFNKMQMVAYTIWEEWIINSRSEAIGWNCKK